MRLDEPLARHTSLRIGGKARFFIRPQGLSALRLVVIGLKEHKIPIFIIGAGSNILAGDKGVKGAVLKMDAPYFKKISLRGRRITAGCSAALGGLLREAGGHSLSGLEFSVGIPGTLGWALVMNAGAWGKEIAEIVEKVKVMDYNGRIKTLTRSSMHFGYRKSCLGKYIVLSAVLKLSPASRQEISGRVREYLRRRRAAQDSSFPNAGCIFKNPAGRSAGRLIELCGLKGKNSGGVRISRRHANFILNYRNGSSGDVLRLMEIAARRVKDKFGISLKPEIVIW